MSEGQSRPGEQLHPGPEQPRSPVVVAAATMMLCETLKTRNRQQQAGALWTLKDIGPNEYPKLPEALKTLYADPELELGVKADVRSLYFGVAHRENGQD